MLLFLTGRTLSPSSRHHSLRRMNRANPDEQAADLWRLTDGSVAVGQVNQTFSLKIMGQIVRNELRKHSGVR
jgi:hypothetical protein